MKDKKESGHYGHKNYLLTLDLYETLEVFARTGLKIPDRKFCETSSEKLAAKLEESLPECSLEVIEFNTVINQLAALVRKISMELPEAVVVSTVPDIAAKLGGHCLQVNRIVDCKGDLIGIGPRPGHASLSEQLGQVARDRTVILVEDGSFSGTTVSTIIQIASHSVEDVVVGFLFPRAKKHILEAFPKEDRIHSLREDHFLDWMPDHDFYPFLPNSGRVVGHNYNGRLLPVYLHNGLSLTMPYLLPYGRPAEWASILKEKAYDFSLFCLHETLALFRLLEELNGEEITLETLLGTYPRASFAVCPDQKDFPHIKTRIVSILSDDAHML